MKVIIANIRLICFIISWLSSISLIVWDSETNAIATFGSIFFIIFLLFTLPLIKLQSFFIILFLISLLFLVIGQLPDQGVLFDSVTTTLMFAGLISTMGLVRATGLKLNTVRKSQLRLSKLPRKLLAPGFQLTAHFFGSVINTGVFAMLAAAIPKDSSFGYRKVAAEASLRGMASSSTWSPFFVAFVVGQIYIDNFNAWLGLAIGLVMATFFLLSLTVLSNKGNLVENLSSSTKCLTPIIPSLIVIMLSVISAAIFFELTALSAIIAVMPILVGLYCALKPKEIMPIVSETIIYLKSTKDEVLVISIAMIVGLLITNDNKALSELTHLQIFDIPDWSILAVIPIVMASLSLVGIHPVISSTILLSVFTNPGYEVSNALIMQAHLIGWCTGTMSSVSSLSVITCARLFNVTSTKLCFGPNTFIALSFAVVGGLTLSLIELIT